ncbi:MAG: sugar ABC transporter substrate-binding protein [Devosia sp.]|uniref:ABC transporter substrate-binding protein n=1 Tax=Devosia sp. TaxID=1871048 RepID=UPI001AC17AE3|nr:sugar ABC transporter substrate-binding protein [Devosia sp.]MBN9315327.1 sugar ABC transporter substrate-binding protein [Devosia sp.]
MPQNLKRFSFTRRTATAMLLGAAAATALPGMGMAQEQVTLQAIFLPATWGVVVRDVLAPQYEKETGVKVDVQLVGRDAIHEKMATLFAAQDPSFDIFNLDYSWIPEFGAGGHLLPLDDLLSEDDKADLFKTALEVGSWNGTLYGLPQTIHPHVLWYRADLYADPEVQAAYKAKTGSDLAPPTTMAEWLQQAAYFNGTQYEGQTIYGWAAQAAKGFGNVHTWLTFLYGYGGSAFNEDFSASTLSTPEAIAATKQWAEMMKYMPPGSSAFTYDDVTTSAQQGTVATALQWSWGAFAVDDPASSKTVGDWQFVEVPAVEAGGQSHPHLASWVISVSKYSKHADEAKKFTAWLETKANDVLQASLGGGDPVRASSYSDPTLTEAKLEGSDVLRFRRYDVVLKAMQNTKPRPFFPGEEAWETVVSGPLQAIQLGEKSVEDGLAEADAAVDRLLSR